MSTIPSAVIDHAAAHRLVGSRVTCDPPPVNTDQDVLVYVRRHQVDRLFSALERDGWKFDGSEAYANSVREGQGFRSYRKGDVNLVVTSEREFYDRFVAATTVAKHLNLLQKSDRVALFQAVLYGNPIPEHV